MFVSQAARDAQQGGYGDEGYWAYLDQSAQEMSAFFAGRGDTATAEAILTRSLSEALAGNEGA